MNTLVKEFLLDPEIIYLNHGSFGATPRSVFDYYQSLQRELEQEPVAFLGRDFQTRMHAARQSLAEYLCTQAENLVYLTNATTAINIVARSLPLGTGDEVLSTDHEYGAMDRTWQFLAAKRGFRYIQIPIPMPISSSEHILEHLRKGLTKNTRVIFLSHITSPTSVIFPIREICKEARNRGILTVIDGAHAPGQIPLDLDDLGADFYTGNLHKWLCAPKGSAFLYAHPDRQALLSPLIVSWGWQRERSGNSTFIDHHEWQGTRDPAAFLSVPEAIRFQEENHWAAVQSACHELAIKAQIGLSERTGLAPLTRPNLFAQMVSSYLPDLDPEPIQKRLFKEFNIEVPILRWNERSLIRISIQGYNSQEQVDSLLDALQECLRL